MRVCVGMCVFVCWWCLGICGMYVCVCACVCISAVSVFVYLCVYMCWESVVSVCMCVGE